MLILFDFKCRTCGHVEEVLIDSKEKHIRCEKCTNVADRVISPVRSNLEGITGHFPDAADKWARQHEKAGRQPSETHPEGWK